MTTAPDATRSSTKIRDAIPLHLTYTNHRGETSIRRIIPLDAPRWGSTDWHPEPQWLLRAFDVDKQAEREFALKDFATDHTADLVNVEPAPDAGKFDLDERERADKLRELYQWTGSAWLAGEETDEDENELKARLYSFLCSLIGWFLPAADDLPAYIARQRAEARREALEQALKAAYAAHGGPVGAGDGDTFISGTNGDAARAIRTLLDKEPTP